MNPIDDLMNELELQRDSDNFWKGVVYAFPVGLLMCAAIIYAGWTIWSIF
jgi:hypothetical protein